MKHIEFSNDETGYLEWVRANPEGFVINTSKAKSESYRVLHSACCAYVTELKGSSESGGFTERNYIKICSETVGGLRQWTASEGVTSGVFSQECARCKPWSKVGYESTVKPESLSLENVSELYKKYLELVQFEVTQLDIKPTEARHLIGRLGEFYCALFVGGSMTNVVNQHGFDVVDPNGRRISVKTTAQVTGFVAISSKTIDQVDDLMILQYIDDHLEEVYYGDITTAITSARYYEGVSKYELDISKARSLN